MEERKVNYQDYLRKNEATNEIFQDLIDKTAKSSKEKTKIADENIDVYQKDYQLARALDLIRGIGLYNSIVKK